MLENDGKKSGFSEGILPLFNEYGIIKE